MKQRNPNTVSNNRTEAEENYVCMIDLSMKSATNESVPCFSLLFLDAVNLLSEK
jgi:hypothetical protein